jgi:hypothetical protein
LLRQFRPERPRRGRPPIQDELLLDVAYAQAVEAGVPPIRILVKKFSQLSQARARDLVHRARRRGFLTTATWGRPGGKVTPLARALRNQLTRKTRARRTGRRSQ